MQRGRWLRLIPILLIGACASSPSLEPPEAPSRAPSINASPTSTSLAATTLGAPGTTVPLPDTTRPVVPSPVVSFDDARTLIDGEVLNPGSRAEGLLMNARMVQAVIDFADEESRRRFAYPDTGEWDPERNVTEFIAALPAYAEAGLNAFTVNLQGGNPVDAPGQDRPPWVVTAYGADGTPDALWLDRLDRVISSAADHDMVVILGLFYFGQDHHLADEAAVLAATDAVTDWLIETGHRNVLVEIGNESNNRKYDHEILRPERVTELILRVRERSRGTLLVSTSFTGGVVPPDGVLAASDFVLLHGNSRTADRVAEMVREVEANPVYRARPTPIVFNEDSTELANLEAAVDEGAGWGYHDKGANDYAHGFQAPPVDWSISTPEKRGFFERVSRLTGRR